MNLIGQQIKNLTQHWMNTEEYLEPLRNEYPTRQDFVNSIEKIKTSILSSLSEQEQYDYKTSQFIENKGDEEWKKIHNRIITKVIRICDTLFHDFYDEEDMYTDDDDDDFDDDFDDIAPLPVQ